MKKASRKWAAILDAVARRREVRMQAVRGQEALWEEVSSILYHHDPIGLNFETNPDEYDDDTLVYPGRGLPTTLGDERPQIPAWRERGW
jgi:hypothetical protein